MGYREVYTAANMADEEYNISDKGLGITPEKLSFTVRPGGITEGQFVVAGPPGTAVTGFLTSDNFHMQLRRRCNQGDREKGCHSYTACERCGLRAQYPNCYRIRR